MTTKDTPEQEVLKTGNCAQGKGCEPCRHLCRMGSGALVAEDLPKIAQFMGITVEKLKEDYLEPITKFNTTLWRPKIERKDAKPYGKCIFFDEEQSCTIHSVKPKECKVSTCNHEGESQSLWFTLNHFVNKHDPQSIREYATYLESGGKTLKGASLSELVPDKELLQKILTHKILK